ncbi:MAG: hypothetical protein Kow00121_31560 [Elainellaceae cyanobacterium]
MSQTTPPNDPQTLSAGYALNDLSPDEAAHLAALLDDPAIRAELEAMEQTVEALYFPEEVQPSPALRAAVIAAAQTMLDPPAPPRRVVALPQWVVAGGAIAAATIVALSVSNVWLWRSLQSQKALLAAQTQQQAEDAITVSLQPTDTLDQPASVVVELDPNQLQGTLRIENLPPLESGKVYAVWTVLTPDAPFTTDAKNAILTHVFSLEETGTTQTLRLPAVFQEPQFVRAIAISVEDATAPQRHQSSPILLQEL